MIEDGIGFQVRRDDGGIAWRFSRKRRIGLGLCPRSPTKEMVVPRWS